jgi:hypothetical protein
MVETADARGELDSEYIGQFDGQRIAFIGCEATSVETKNTPSALPQTIHIGLVMSVCPPARRV